MKRTYLFGTMMAFTLAAASVGAQQDRPTPSSSDQPDKSVVVTGCLKSAPSSASATGTAGATGTSGSVTTASFILADAKIAPGGSSASATGTAGTGSTAGTAGTSGTPASSVDKDKDKDKNKTFALVGGSSSELQGYVNSKVEITGTIDPSAHSSAASGSATGTTASPTASTMPGMSHTGDQAKLKVTSVRQVAGSCDAGQQ